MMQRVRYVNHNGAEINLNDGAYFLNANDLRDFSWEYETIGKPSGLGGKIKRFSRSVTEKTVRIAVRGTAAQFRTRMNALHALTEPDILSGRPGRLYLNDQYLICYLSVSSAVATYSERGHFAEKEMTVVAVEPFWHTEVSRRFSSADAGSIVGGKKYNLRFPYRFGVGYANQTLFNSHYAETPMRIIIYGPCTDPDVTIGGNLYSVAEVLSSGERLEIDQLARTITKIDDDGTTENLFDSRDKEHDIFKPAPAGEVSVAFTGTINFEIVLIQQRSEPLWS